MKDGQHFFFFFLKTICLRGRTSVNLPPLPPSPRPGSTGRLRACYRQTINTRTRVRSYTFPRRNFYFITPSPHTPGPIIATVRSVRDRHVKNHVRGILTAFAVSSAHRGGVSVPRRTTAIRPFFPPRRRGGNLLNVYFVVISSVSYAHDVTAAGKSVFGVMFYFGLCFLFLRVRRDIST